MSLDLALARIAELTGTVVQREPLQPVASATAAAGTALPAASASSFAAVLDASGTGAQRRIALAQAEIGQAEQPPGSNDSPRIAQYRSATAGAPGPGPWCGYFVSYIAREAGTPLMDQGQGSGDVDAIAAWAQRSGRWHPVSAGPPRPGDLVVWDEHIGLVESVAPDGSITTIEGNSSDAVTRRTHSAGDALGYVSL